jgi:hypothetical protein
LDSIFILQGELWLSETVGKLPKPRRMAEAEAVGLKEQRTLKRPEITYI